MIDLTELKSRAEALIGRDDIRLAPDVILALIAENERLTNRLEVDPRHDYDGISTRDATVKVLDEQVDQLKAENEQLKAENERLSTENSEIESAAITYIEDMQEAQRENARLTELFTVGMTLDGNLRVYGDWQSVRKAQEILAERDQLRAEIAGLKTGYEAYERVNAELKARKALADIERKDIKVRKEKLKTRADHIREAQQAFNEYIRTRDQAAGHLCISSGKLLDWSGNAVDAGHYRSVGSAPHLRFDERNCHAQSKQDNRFLSGNAVDYRIGLIARIGQEAVDALEADQSVRKYSVEQIKGIKAYYRAKTKELKKGLAA